MLEVFEFEMKLCVFKYPNCWDVFYVINTLSVTFFSQLWGCAKWSQAGGPSMNFRQRPSGMPRTSQSGYPLVNSYHSAKSTSISSGHFHCSHVFCYQRLCKSMMIWTYQVPNLSKKPMKPRGLEPYRYHPVNHRTKLAMASITMFTDQWT